MRLATPLILLTLATTSPGQNAPISPTEELRTTLREWVETMRKAQQEENDWQRDREVLENYREGLQQEVATLKEKLAEAKTRKEGADRESLEQSAERDRYAAARQDLSATVRKLEESLAAKLPLLPRTLAEEPKVAQGVDDLRRDLELPADKRDDGVAKRLMNVIQLLTEAEKFQTTAHLRTELHTNSQGREFNMQVLYFGLACAYAVNEDGSFALVGRPSAEGWRFEERPELAGEIRRIVAATTGDADASFVSLPLPKP
jgi:hypothetical protein